MLYQNHIKLLFIRKGLLLLVFSGLFWPLLAQTGKKSNDVSSLKSKREELEKQRKQLEAQISQTKSVLDQNKKQQEASLTALTTLNTQIKLRENVIDNIGQQIFELSLEIQQQKQVIELLVNDIDRIKSDYAQNILAAYKMRNAGDKLVFIFNAKDFNQAFMRLKYLNQFNLYRQQQARLILKTQQTIIAEINRMIAIKQQKMNLIGMKEQEKKLLEQDKVEKQVVLTKLQQSEKQLKAELANKQKAAEKLNLAIKELIAKEIAEARRAEEARRKAAAAKAAKTGAKPVAEKNPATMSPEMFKLSNDFESNKGKLPWPVDNGFISERFGEYAHPTLKGIKTFNNGINISTAKGNTARAIYKGTVKAIFSVPGMERVVLVNHGEYYSVYANLEAVLVKIGQEVKTGESLGTVFTNEETKKTEIHLEIYKQKQMQNPALWLRNN